MYKDQYLAIIYKTLGVGGGEVEAFRIGTHILQFDRWGQSDFANLLRGTQILTNTNLSFSLYVVRLFSLMRSSSLCVVRSFRYYDKIIQSVL